MQLFVVIAHLCPFMKLDEICPTCKFKTKLRYKQSKSDSAKDWVIDFVFICLNLGLH